MALDLSGKEEKLRMSKRHSTKYKIDRRMGENIWGRPKSPVNKRAYPPGQHGANARRGKLSDFGTQLRAKQKLKGYYGNITEKQFRRTYDEATRQRGDASENLIGLLEYVSVDPKGMQATFTRVPSFDEVPYPVVMEPNLVVEFYSR